MRRRSSAAPAFGFPWVEALQVTIVQMENEAVKLISLSSSSLVLSLPYYLRYSAYLQVTPSDPIGIIVIIIIVIITVYLSLTTYSPLLDL
jgi:hypothetical protein